MACAVSVTVSSLSHASSDLTTVFLRLRYLRIFSRVHALHASTAILHAYSATGRTNVPHQSVTPSAATVCEQGLPARAPGAQEEVALADVLQSLVVSIIRHPGTESWESMIIDTLNDGRSCLLVLVLDEIIRDTAVYPELAEIDGGGPGWLLWSERRGAIRARPHLPVTHRLQRLR